eukprot:TRINITY_DN8763_c0_g1_i1.p1 TRINITY_DN8763_c0_g1~~TRINITY_DN8763_c0_g1_i1.p1  ORF type:complete len:101 (+),score=3.30 TRINITY_DN8763_c0_g1_i1:168-470(+)
MSETQRSQAPALPKKSGTWRAVAKCLWACCQFTAFSVSLETTTDRLVTKASAIPQPILMSVFESELCRKTIWLNQTTLMSLFELRLKGEKAVGYVNWSIT